MQFPGEGVPTEPPGPPLTEEEIDSIARRLWGTYEEPLHEDIQDDEEEEERPRRRRRRNASPEEDE